MNAQQQIQEIREKKRIEYLNYLKNSESNSVTNDIICDNNIFNDTTNIMDNNINSHNNIICTITKEIKNNAAKKIQQFIRKKYFEPECINQQNISNIPVLFRFRINITNIHINEYSEENIPQDLINIYRLSYDNIHYASNKTVLFKYCFDVRDLFPKRNQIIEIMGNFFFLQPKDHIEINKLWKKVNNDTPDSINYINNFEYYKSLSVDMYK
ncbi:hypothetical protein QKC54_gp0335 [Megavirus baoshan]|uniref:Uncharacterized protein n=1 Tax=Megavirus baoshan TaxID=2496520 RepID=A0A3S5HLB4_9VIRU|nr:hypothetical protein QKC54_gp0335 [Megavirus baoshan]AZL89487.1 hypothetical protein Mb0737 [Megavirus baoshan]